MYSFFPKMLFCDKLIINIIYKKKSYIFLNNDFLG